MQRLSSKNGLTVLMLMLVLLRSRVLLMGCLAAVLVLTQTLGLIHSVTHARLNAPIFHSGHEPAITEAGNQHQLVARAAQSELSWVAAAFSSHRQDTDCQLYDQCSHGAGVANLVHQLLPVLLPPSQVAIFQGNALARWAALFDARGPPLTV